MRTACIHCGARLTGRWCARCGQEVRLERLTTRRVVRGGLAELFDLESGLPRTVRDLLIDPARTIRGYWEGHTRPWVHPAKFFLLSFAAAQFVAWRTGALRELADGFLEGASSSGIESAEVIVGFLAEYTVVLVAAGLVVPLLVATRISRRTLAEMTVLFFFAFGQLACVGTALLAVRWVAPAFPGAELLLLATPLYLGWVLHRVFRLGLVRSGVGAIALVIGTLVGVMFVAGFATGASEGARG